MTQLSVGVDVGGTFTDLVAVDGSGAVSTGKVPSTPSDQSEGVAQSLALLRGAGVSRFVHGTTVATNMLLERRGARVALVATDGFTDVLQLARQDRASLYDLARHHPPPLVARDHVVGARERLVPEGVHVPLTEDAIADVVERVRRLGADVVAISLLHAYADPSHERRLCAAITAALPGVQVVTSSDVFPEIREYERTATTVAEAYLRPGVARYLERLTAKSAAMGVPAPGVMTSGGGMRTVEQAVRGAASLALSGPAGGVVGAAAAVRAAGFDNALTVDIGGTSADVGLILGGAPLVEPGGRVAGVPIALPRVLVETVSAGGGSIGWIDDGGALRVGPRSAGAVPGPAAFGRGGTEPTVTDAHVVLGHITAAALSGGVSLDLDAARRAVSALAERLGATPERVAQAMVATADASVARALRRVSVERGVNPRDCVLVPFGGGGPLHACGLAEQLGMSRIFVPPHAGVLSALGLAITPERRERMVSVLAHAGGLDATALGAILDRAAHGVAADPSWARAWTARMRYEGQGHELDIPVERTDDGATLAARFEALHAQRNGFTLPAPAEIIGVRHVASGAAHAVRFTRSASSTWSDASRVDDGGTFAARIAGPAVVVLEGATLRVARGWVAQPHPTGGWTLALIPSEVEESAPHPASESAIDPLELSVLAHGVAMIAEEMGAVLVRSALSPNIRERRDASSAIFDARGRMIAQAAHIPVHLGAMPESVAAVRERNPQPGDVFLLNDPYRGGSHLPDLTLVEAIGIDGVVGAYAAVRAHHADVGGMSPGSMPQGATELVQEGLIVPPVRLVRAGVLDEELLGFILANVRTPEERRGDLGAQLAACATGAAGWRALHARLGGTRLDAACDALLDYAERRVRARLGAMGNVSGRATDRLEGDGVTEDDIPVVVSLAVRDGTLHLDLTGSAPQVAGNVNCPAAVSRAAAVFALRTLLDDDVPTNDGIARAIALTLPERSAVNAAWPAAVAAGNVEMSQRIADTILAAFGLAGVDVAAQGQGTMNNVTFGGAGWTFYETLGGGQGASASGPGPSGVHVGMSNTLNTPVESLERSTPLRVDRYALRDGSGGAGQHAGGHGVVRSYRATAPCTVTLLTERRRHAPRGVAGGSDGAPGRNLLNGAPLPAKCRRSLVAGDVVTIETPGGGGHGTSTTTPAE